MRLVDLRAASLGFLARDALPGLAGLGVLAGLLGLLSLVPAVSERLHLAAFDTIERLSPRQRGSAQVVVVDVDDESLRRIGQWPWSRRTMAALVDGVETLKPTVIGFDMQFSEPDRTSPSILLPAWEKEFGFRAADPVMALPDNDALLAQAFSRSHVVTGFGAVAGGAGTLPAHLAGIAMIGRTAADGEETGGFDRYAGVIANLPVLDAAAAGHGLFTVLGGADQVTRRVPLVMAVGDRILPSLTLDMLRVMQDESTIRIRAEHVGGSLSGYTVRVGDVSLPVDTQGYFWLHHPAALSTRTVPAWKLLDAGEREPLRATIGGAAILIGTSAVGLVDLRPTPLSAFEPGVNINAGVIEQALDGRLLTRPVWAPNAERLATGVFGLLMISLIAGGLVRTAAILAVCLAAGALGGCVALFLRAGLLFDPQPLLLGLALTVLATSLVRYALNERSALRLRKAFTHYLSPDLVAALARQPGSLKLGGESREMTFLFTDLEGFTSLTEKEGAEALVTLLNAYLDNLCRIAMDHGGTVDKIVGDAMHVMFNAPLDQPDHARRAVACALALDVFATAFAASQRQAGLAFGATRIGINTGRAVVGNFGGSRRFDYTAHGDAINTAARLESANKALGTRICVARSTKEQAPDNHFRPIGTLMLKGKSVGVEVYEPLVDADEARQADRYRAAFARFEAGEDEAATELLRLHAERPTDPVLRLYARRIEAGERSVRIAA